MEEAEALSDRIMIMKKGEVQCIGDSLSLKEKYADSYAVSLTTKRRWVEVCKKSLKKKLGKGLEIEVYNGEILRFQVGFDEVKKVFQLLKKGEGLEGKVSDWEFCQPSLDDVFMNLAEDEKEEGVF